MLITSKAIFNELEIEPAIIIFQLITYFIAFFPKQDSTRTKSEFTRSLSISVSFPFSGKPVCSAISFLLKPLRFVLSSSTIRMYLSLLLNNVRYN